MNSTKAQNTETTVSNERRSLIGMAPLQLKHPQTTAGSSYLAGKIESCIQQQQSTQLNSMNQSLPASVVAPLRQNDTSSDFFSFASQPAAISNWKSWAPSSCSSTPQQQEDPGLDHADLLNKIGCACLQQRKRQDASSYFASALLELQKYAPLVSESHCGTIKLAAMLKNLTSSSCVAPPMDDAKPNRSLYIYQREMYDEGIYMYQDPLPLRSSDSRAAMEATLLYNLGQSLVQGQRYQEARDWFQLALLVVGDGSESSSSSIDSFLMHQNLGNCFYRLGDNDSALEHFQKALVQASQQAGGVPTLDLATSYNSVAVLLFHKSHPAEPSKTALEYLQLSLASYNSILGGRGGCTKEVATVLSNIGRVYFLRADYEQSLEFFQRSLSIRQMVLEPDSVDILTAMFNVAQTQHRLRSLDTAMTYYRGFLEGAQVQLGTDHRDFAAGLVLLSDLHRERKEFSEAQVLLEQAIRCGRAALGESHPDLALIFNNLGSLTYELRNYDGALSYYMECAKIQSEFLEKNHPHIVISLLNVAQIHKQRGDYSTAFKVYREVYAIHFETFGPDSMEVATTVSSMALMKYLVKDYQVSLNFYQEALRLHRERKVGVSSKQDLDTRDMDIASTLNSIGLVLFKMDYFDMAKDVFVECLSIRKRVLGEDHRDIAIMIYNIATIYLEKGEDHTAMKLYSESLRVERRALGAKHPEISCTLQHLGQMHQEKGELEKAVEYFQEALEIERMVLSTAEDSASLDATMASVCKLLNLIGNIHLMCGRVDSMMKCFEEACKCGQHNGEGLIIAGHNFYGLSRMHPPCAPLA